MPHTPHRIVLIVVSTLAVCTMLYMTTLAVCVLRGLTPPESVMREFATAGIFLSGYFCGLLTKTSGTPSNATEVTETKVTSTPDPK